MRIIANQVSMEKDKETGTMTLTADIFCIIEGNFTQKRRVILDIVKGDIHPIGNISTSFTKKILGFLGEIEDEEVKIYICSTRVYHTSIINFKEQLKKFKNLTVKIEEREGLFPFILEERKNVSM